MGVLSFIRRSLISTRCPLVHSHISPFNLSARRRYSDEAKCPKPVCVPLSHRALVKICGQDTGQFLQGIITNDMRLLEEERSVLYAHLLNVQGRTLFDVLIYSLKEAEPLCGVLLECDRTLTDSLLRHLKTYKIRRKVTVQPCPELSAWAVLPAPGKPELQTPEKGVAALEADPRTVQMGWRLVMDSSADPEDVITRCQRGELQEYHKHRYTIGLPEGPKDLPPGVALPLESNIVFMNGISFSKGCYIGQELTARTHHTGVIRKRLMPLQLSSPNTAENLEEGVPLQTHGGKPAGKHRSGLSHLGLGLVRTAHAKEELMVKSSEDKVVTLRVSVPEWWPEDAKTLK